MLPGKCLVQALLLLGVPIGVYARRGGGDGDGDSDSSSGDDTGGSSTDGSSSDDHCGSSHQSLTVYDVIPRNVANWTSMTAPWKDLPTTYDGSYYYGEAFLNYTISGDSHCSESQSPVRMLAYAWVGPQTPYPKGYQNQFALGFKAWLSDLPLDQIANSYDKVSWADYCPIAPDLVKLQTTTSYTDFDKRTVNAFDVMDMEFSLDQNHDDTVVFNGTFVEDLDTDNLDQNVVSLPPSVCVTDGVQGLGWPSGTTLVGSVTNSTLELKLEGVSNTTTDYKHYVGSDSQDEILVTFSVTFTGAFDAINSTNVVNVTEDDQTTLSWVENSSSSVVSTSWISLLVWMAFMGSLCLSI